ncbi:MAG: ABC transporter permease [Acidimicrobiales bacterium]|nr:ABC transporter permease [Acidimicrobiales bacterium]
MSYLTALILGLGSGAVIAALGLGVVVAHRVSRVVNFAHAAIGMYVAFVYYELRASGDLVLPFLGLPDRVHLVDRPTVSTALILSLVLAALCGALIYLVIFRPLRNAPPLARVVASLGLFVYLIAIAGLRFVGTGSASLILDGPLPDHLVIWGDLRVIADRYWLAVIVVIAAAVLSVGYRFTRLGLATRAVAGNERGAVLMGVSPNAIGIVNWVIASVLAGGAVILAAPVVRLEPTATSLLIVPAVAAALPGKFNSVWITVFTGLGIGMAQSLIQHLQRIWEWLPDLGLQQGLPLLIVLVTLAIQGEALPDRSALQTAQLPRAPDTRWVPAVTAVLLVIGIVVASFAASEWRSGLIISAIATIVALSVVVLTGYVGQISLATFAMAGVAAFAMVRFTDDWSMPFPIAPILGVLVAVFVGAVAAIPAVRVRGLNLAIATLAGAVAVEELVFKWGWFTGGFAGATAESPSIFGFDLGISALGKDFPRRTFVIMVLVLAALSIVAVGNLRRGSTGRRWLAVRANERAAAAAGIPVAQVKLSAFAISSALAGLAGVLLAYQRSIVSAGSFGVLDSLVAVAIAYLAGIATPIGAVVAGVLATGGLLTVFLDSISDSASKYQFAVNGIMLIVAAIKFPQGIVGVRNRKAKVAT